MGAEDSGLASGDGEGTAAARAAGGLSTGRGTPGLRRQPCSRCWLSFPPLAFAIRGEGTACSSPLWADTEPGTGSPAEPRLGHEEAVLLTSRAWPTEGGQSLDGNWLGSLGVGFVSRRGEERRGGWDVR